SPASQSCGSYQTCTGTNEWSPAYPCQCSGTCYPAPSLKSIDDSSLSPQNVFEDVAKTKVKLPVNVGVTDSLENDEKMKDQSCVVDSYHYEFSSSSSSATENGGSSLVPQSCSLNPNTTYEISAKACLAGNCGKESEPLSFSASSAPELKSPYDPDWEQASNAGAPHPIIFQWCQAPDTTSYKLNVFKQTGVTLTPLASAIPINAKTAFSEQDFLNATLETFQNGIAYFWELASCKDTKCGSLSQRWSFVPGGQLTTPTLRTPNNGAAVNLSTILSWQRNDTYATHYRIRIEGEPTLKPFAKDYFVYALSYPLSQLQSDLNLNAQYTWKVAGCSGGDYSRCENQSQWSETWKFKTTGASPTGLATKPKEADKTAIPATLFWNNMPGAASYAWEAGNNNGVAINSEARVDNLLQGANYSWRVKTCADALGKICGNWSSSTLNTAILTAPQITSPKPGTEEIIPSANLSWNSVFSGNFYSYDVQYPAAPENETSSCKDLVGKSITQGILSQNSMRVAVRCTGQYQLKVAACIDAGCQTKGPESVQLFSVEEPDATQGGLIPCGRSVDDKSTASWDERSPCELKHIFLLVHNLIDFALWKLSLIIAALMAIATGTLIYFSLGTPTMLQQIKSIWKAVGIGILIMLFAWIVLNVLLDLLGFNINIFGRWYELKT
ncbi:MAG: hypothetical protein HYS60_02540, partial [Candidatus Wildermuthbacteria bacterium]|nr:hypothetical protein [Candidatus Wildermuthbacteria bacterium]